MSVLTTIQLTYQLLFDSLKENGHNFNCNLLICRDSFYNLEKKETISISSKEDQRFELIVQHPEYANSVTLDLSDTLHFLLSRFSRDTFVICDPGHCNTVPTSLPEFDRILTPQEELTRARVDLHMFEFSMRKIWSHLYNDEVMNLTKQYLEKRVTDLEEKVARYVNTSY